MTRLRNEGMIFRASVMQKALGEPQRMRIMKILGSSGRHTHNVSDIAKLLDISQAATTKHLKILHDAGFVTRERVDSNIFYSVDQAGLREYRQVLDCGFKAQTTPCTNHYHCETCPENSTCNTDFQWEY
ncbi:MAG: metalloregulator ArsR/SmtB family transcription factor [Raoultibacter sp.]